ncbi:hypothetical protein ICI39_14130 [Listeria welshimeri]|nr:hypothetical protein [Listeria welshimeri]
MAVSLDIAKAFDRVWHKALLAKLPSYGLPERLCSWVASFLDGRSIKVVVDGICSETMPINAGVPQGSVLSPTLFILHINDILQTSNINCLQMTARVMPFILAGLISLGRKWKR